MSYINEIPDKQFNRLINDLKENRDIANKEAQSLTEIIEKFIAEREGKK